MLAGLDSALWPLMCLAAVGLQCGTAAAASRDGRSGGAQGTGSVHAGSEPSSANTTDDLLAAGRVGISASPLLQPLAPPAPERIANGGYPRGVVHAGMYVVCVGMTIYARAVTAPASTSPAWIQRGTVATDPRPGVDLANCNLAVRPATPAHTGTAMPLLVASYRHHTGCHSGTIGYADDGQGQKAGPGQRRDLPHLGSAFVCSNYTIQVSTSLDAGVTWRFASTVVSGPVGMWEPFLLYDDPANSTSTGVAAAAQGPLLRVAYSQELTNGGLQSIVWQRSGDDGATWAQPVTISDGREHLSRDGMPGIARLIDGSLLLVFEGFWAHGPGHFSVQSRRSRDNGLTWDDGRVIYATTDRSRNAGAPQTAVQPSGRVVVSFMTNEDVPRPSSWPDDAWAKVIVSNNTGSGGDEVIFPAAGKRVVCTGPACLWPGLFGQDPVLMLYGLHGVSFMQPISDTPAEHPPTVPTRNRTV